MLPHRGEHDLQVNASFPALPWPAWLMMAAVDVYWAFTGAGNHIQHFTGTRHLNPTTALCPEDTGASRVTACPRSVPNLNRVESESNPCVHS